MFITFEPTGEVVEIGDGSGIIPQFTVGLGELAPAVYTTPSGYTPVQTVLSSGSPASVLAGASAGYYVRFFNGLSKTLLVTKFEMDDETALSTAHDTVNAALGSSDATLMLKSDGTAGS